MKRNISLYVIPVLLSFFSMMNVCAGPFDFGEGSVGTSYLDSISAKLEKEVRGYPALNWLYRELFYTPVWIGERKPTPFARVLLDRISRDRTVPPVLTLPQKAENLGRELVDLYDRNSASLDRRVALEVKFSRLYLEYVRYLLYGGIDWEAFDEKRRILEKKYDSKVGWDHYASAITPASLIAKATVSGDLDRAFDRAEPRRFKYVLLKKNLLKYIEIAEMGGWKKLPAFKVIKPGQSHPAVLSIRRHLEMEGDLKGCSSQSDSPVYDECLQKAVKRFKLRHGMKGTSVIDSQTRKWLNVSVERKILLLRLNLDRIKWLWREKAPVRIELNIPAFRLYFYEGDRLIDTMRVITGKPNHPTPSFHDVMEYIVVNPYWKIPQSIVKKEMLKDLIRDPYYYERRGKILKATWDENSPRVDPGSINWAAYRGKKPIPYYFMQVPGTSNALGKIKFLFPNHYSVYIHDTPTKKLFFKNIRAFSHGCMRIQKPRELLKVLALYNDNIDVEDIMQRLGTRVKKTIVLKRKIPVDITYLTAYVDDYGNLNFRKDIYNFDKYQLQRYAYNPYVSKKEKDLVPASDTVKVKSRKR
jgi:murein L,D-transpeptidase YcbB/YkuD